MQRRRDDGSKERFRLEAGMGGIVMVTLILLFAQLQIDAAALMLH
jgi:hypothetical protein